MATSEKSADEVNLLVKRKPEDDLETTTILKKHKETSEEKETTKGFADSLHLLETNSDQANLISVKEAAVRKKTLFVNNIPHDSKIPNIIDFFKNVGQVVRVQLIVHLNSKLVGCGFVEFASSNDAEKALQKKNGEYLLDHKIDLDVATKGAKYLPPKYCIDHKVRYKDYLPRKSFLVDEDETPPDSVEEVLFVSNLSPQTKLLHIINFFNDVSKVVSVRLIVNNEGKHVGYGFVEFASANNAKKALEEKNGEYLHDHQIFLQVAKTVPHPPQPKYNLVEMLCYEDYHRRQNLLIEEDDEIPPDSVEAVAVRKKTLFVDRLRSQIQISHIINFFKDVAEVVHVRLIVDHKGKRKRCGFVEFASADEAEKALEKKYGEYLHGWKLFLDMTKTSPYPSRPKHCLDHKVWYEDYLQRESLLIDEDRLDEIPDLVEEIARRKKTLFFANLSTIKICNFIKFFKDVGEVVHVRLIVNHKGKHMGCGFVEFASANQAQKALRKKYGENFVGRVIFLDVAEIAPYPLRPRYNLAEKLWYEDYLQREGLPIEEDDLETKPKLKKQKVPEMAEFCRKKITFSEDSEDDLIKED